MSRTVVTIVQAAAICVALVGASVLAAGPQVQKTPAPTLKDRIQFGLETSNIVKTYDITVKVTGTSVVLAGTVATQAQKDEAERVAKIAGATKIQNDILVDKGIDATLADRMKAGLTKTGDKITDIWITTKVKWFFWGDDLLRGSEINVDVANGIVTLKGTVKTAAGHDRAVALATGTAGVHRVVDQLTVAK